MNVEIFEDRQQVDAAAKRLGRNFPLYSIVREGDMWAVARLHEMSESPVLAMCGLFSRLEFALVFLHAIGNLPEQLEPFAELEKLSKSIKRH